MNELATLPAPSLVPPWKRTRLPSRRCRFDPWAGKILWRRAWQPTPIFLPGESHGQRSLAGYSPQGRRRVRDDLTTKQQKLKKCCWPGPGHRPERTKLPANWRGRQLDGALQRTPSTPVDWPPHPGRLIALTSAHTSGPSTSPSHHTHYQDLWSRVALIHPKTGAPQHPSNNAYMVFSKTHSHALISYELHSNCAK